MHLSSYNSAVVGGSFHRLCPCLQYTNDHEAEHLRNRTCHERYGNQHLFEVFIPCDCSIYLDFVPRKWNEHIDNIAKTSLCIICIYYVRVTNVKEGCHLTQLWHFNGGGSLLFWCIFISLKNIVFVIMIPNAIVSCTWSEMACFSSVST